MPRQALHVGRGVVYDPSPSKTRCALPATRSASVTGENVRKNKRLVALFVDEAHDMNGHTLTGLKRLRRIYVSSIKRRPSSVVSATRASTTPSIWPPLRSGSRCFAGLRVRLDGASGASLWNFRFACHHPVRTPSGRPTAFCGRENNMHSASSASAVPVSLSLIRGASDRPASAVIHAAGSSAPIHPDLSSRPEMQLLQGGYASAH